MTMVQKEKGISIMPIVERSAMPVTMPGRAMGSSSASEITLAAKEAAAMHRRRGQRPQHQRCARRQRRHAHRQPERLPEIGALQRHAKPMEGQARQREGVAASSVVNA
jgi:hypothetical protein